MPLQFWIDLSSKIQNLYLQTAATISFLFLKKWLIMLCLAAFIEATGMGIISPINSLYAQSFGLNTSQIGVFMTSFAIGRVLVNFPAGRIADRFGRRKLIVLGPFILTFAALGLASATNYTQLLFSRFLSGVGSGLFLIGAFLVLADLSLAEDRGKVNGLFQASTIFGLTISPFIGGIIATNMGYQAVFYLDSVIVFLMGIFVWRQFPESLGRGRIDESVSLDTEESMSRLPHDKMLRKNHLLLIGIVGFIIFVSRSGSRDTLLPLIGAGFFKLNPTKIGIIFTISAAANFMAVPIAGYLCDRRGRKPVVLFGLFLNSLGLLSVGWQTNLLPFVFGAILMAFGKGFGETSSIVYVADISHANKYGRSYGLFLSLRDFGLLIGPFALAWIADRTNLNYPLVLNGIIMLMIMVLFGFFAKESLPKNEAGITTGVV